MALPRVHIIIHTFDEILFDAQGDPKPLTAALFHHGFDVVRGRLEANKPHQLSKHAVHIIPQRS